MKVDAPMDSYAARLDSFNATLTTKKKRASDTKGGKALRWPHDAPSPPQLARAGFFYKPTATNPDNATCYLCHCNLDGWEEEDDPIAEHLKHSPSCGWANTASIEQAVENGDRDLENPRSERLTNARIMTFGSTWPHENKRGWVCKTQKMVEAGWHYCPTLESDDFVRCAYCNLSLDGWEPKDNPYDEHQRRSPDCMFFSLSSGPKPAKVSKAKNNRTSKATRMSTQSSLSVASDGAEIAETEPRDEDVLPLAEPVKPAKGGKGGKRGKKLTVDKLMPNQDNTQLGSSFIEPEDDDFEVKVAPPPKAKNKKRKSEDMADVCESSSKNATRKRRTTRAGTSVANVQPAPELTIEVDQPEEDQNLHMTDADDFPPPSKPASKKGGKGSKKRGSSTSRKASSKSTASEASLRAGMPNDEEIEALIEEELDRPLTDDGEDDEVITKPAKGRRLTRSKPALKATAASTALTRGTTRTSNVTIDDSMDDLNPDIPGSNNIETQPKLYVKETDPEPLPKAKAGKKIGNRKASAKQKAKDEDFVEPAETVPTVVSEAIEVVKPKQTRGRKLSQKISSQVDVDIASNVNSSVFDISTDGDDSGHEKDAGVASTKGRPKKGGRKPSTTKKTKGVKKAALKSRDFEGFVQPAADKQLASELQEAATAEVDGVEEPELEARESKKTSKKQSKAPKAAAKPKGKKAASKAQNIKEEATLVNEPKLDEPWGAALSPLAASVLSTPNAAESLQSSDAENQPPSSRPSQSRPPLSLESPVISQETRVPLAVITTPISSPTKGNCSKLQSTFPWTAMDIDQVFNSTNNAEKENEPFVTGAKTLTSPEKKLNVEEWIKSNAQRGEEKLRNECEHLVGKFEDHGVRALRTLEGIVCVD